MRGTIDVVAETGELILLDEQGWHKDADFLNILARHPDRLGTDQIEASDG